jgi:hypothetical protein
VQIQYNLVPKTGVVNGVTYPGYEVTLKSLDAYWDFVMLGAKSALYSLSDKESFTAYTEVYENVGAPARRNVLTFTKQPTYKIPWNSLGNYATDPRNMPANGEFKFWVPMGYGMYDSQMKEFYTELASAPKDLPWIYSPTNGKFRVNSNFNYMDVAVWVFKSDVPGTTTEVAKTIRLIFPYYPSDPGAYYSTLTKSTISQVLIRNNGQTGADRIPDLYMDETEVTQKDYQLLMGKNPFNFPLGPDYPVEGLTLYDAILYSNKRSQFEGLNPVYSYTDATFSSNGNNCIGLTGLTLDVNKNGYRLPTREEWKYAYLANGTSLYYYCPIRLRRKSRMHGDSTIWAETSWSGPGIP